MKRLPMKACDAIENKISYPCALLAKIDGVRGLNTDGPLTTRTLKPFANVATMQRFSRPEYIGIDGEFAAEHETHPRLCSLTTSATSTMSGDPFLIWHAFDYINEDTIELGYQWRHDLLQNYVTRMHAAGLMKRVKLIPYVIVNNPDQLLEQESIWLGMGYEGVVGRGLASPHKAGRATAREGGYWRIKRFVQEEFLITKINEGDRNDNEAQTNELGRTFRSSHQDNKVSNGMVGSMEGTILKDSVLFRKGQVITVSKGTMTQEDATHYFNNQHLLLNQIGSFKHFPKGVKDKPRFPIFQSLRDPGDM